MNTPMLRTLIGSVLLTTLLGACSITDIPRAIANHPNTDIEFSALHQASRIRAMSATESVIEAESLQKAYSAHRSEETRLRLALFLAVAAPPLGDRLRALTLLDVPANETNGRGRNHPLAQLLLPLLQDYRRADEAQSGVQQKLRDMQQSNDQMRQKLDAIREIEVKMQERPKPK